MKRRMIPILAAALLFALTGVLMVYSAAPMTKVMASIGGTLAVLAIPFTERRLNVRFPWWLQASLILFTIAALLLGTIIGFYGFWHPWDDMLHLLSGVLIAGVAIVLLEQKFGKLHVVLPVGGRIVLVGMFAASMALLWEIAEFSSDQVLGTFSQLGDLNDTMQDMIFGTITVVVTASVYYGVARLSAGKASPGSAKAIDTPKKV